MERPIVHELHDDHGRIDPGDHPVQLDDIIVIKLPHDGSFIQEICPHSASGARLQLVKGHDIYLQLYNRKLRTLRVLTATATCFLGDSFQMPLNTVPNSPTQVQPSAYKYACMQMCSAKSGELGVYLLLSLSLVSASWAQSLWQTPPQLHRVRHRLWGPHRYGVC